MMNRRSCIPLRSTDREKPTRIRIVTRKTREIYVSFVTETWEMAEREDDDAENRKGRETCKRWKGLVKKPSCRDLNAYVMK